MKCDELKVYHCNEWHNEYTEFYMKYDVDDAIAELKQKLEEQESVIAELKAQKAQVEDDRAYWESKAHRERHHKYKRCLAMAMWCAAECVVNQNTNKAYLTHKSDFRTGHYWKWEKRWLELANKFKEAK